MMDELLGYPTEFRGRARSHRDGCRADAALRHARQHAVRQGFGREQLDARQVRELVPLARRGQSRAGISIISAATPIRNARCRHTPGHCRITAGG